MEYKQKTLGTIADYINGRAFKPTEWEMEGLPIVRIQNLTDENARYNYTSVDYEEKYRIYKGDLLFAWSASLGAHIWRGETAWLNQHIFKVIPHKDIQKEYLYYFLQNVVGDLYSKTHGSGMVHITKKPFMETRIPVPVLDEQTRIVARIEELFSELDKAVETLKTVKEQLAVYRQAVLKEAFDFNNMDKCTEIAALVDDIRIGPFGTALHKSDYIKSGIPVINPQHIKKGKIKSTPNVTVTEEKAEALGSYKLKVNDIIMGRRGEMGRAAAVTEAETGWICGTGSMLFRMKSEYDARLYAQILSSPDVVHYLEENATGTTMKNLNENIVKHIPVPVITREKQKRIMEKVDETMSVCDSIEKTVETALQQAEALRQSVLKKAFEGQLV